MATGMTARIRLVKCPRCHRLLPELPGIPVYKCGGCDAILVAKNRTDGPHETGLGSLNNSDSSQRREVDPPSEDKQPSTSNHEAIIPPHGESSLDLNNRSHTNESGEWNSEEQGNARNDDESHHENGETSDGDKAEEASISSSSHEAIIPSSGECVIYTDVEKDQDESGDSSSEQLVCKKLGECETYATNNNESHASHDEPSGFPNEVYREEKFAYHENDELPCRDALEPEEYSIPTPERITLSSDECFIEPNDVKDQKESEDVSQEQLPHIKSSECLKNAGSNDESRGIHDEQPSCSHQSSSRIAFSSHGNADISGLDSLKATETTTLSHEVLTIPFSGESVLDPNDEKDQKKDEDIHMEQLVQISSSENGKSASTDDESPACHGEQSRSLYRVSFANEVANHENNKLSCGDAAEDGINDDILHSREESPEADDRKEIHSSLDRSDISNAVAINSTITEHAEEHEETISCDFDRRIPVDNSACMEANHCIEPSVAPLGMVKSLTTKSSFAYDGMDDQFLDHQRLSLKNIHESSNFLAVVEGPRREESLLNNNAVTRDSETPIEASSSWKSLAREKHYGVEYSERIENDMLQQKRQDLQNRSTLRREKYQSKLLLLERDRQGDYENGSVPSSMFDEPHDSRMQSSDNVVEHDEEKARLLRMVYELQDELAKSCNVNGNASGRVSMGSTQKDTVAPMYYNHQIPQEESWHGSEYSSYSQRSRPRTNYPEQHSLSRMTSAANAVSAPLVNYYGMEHFPENIPHSRQVLPPEHWHYQGARMAHIDHDYYSQYSSCASSPQHFLGTQWSGRGTRMQSDHMHHNNERSYSRKNNHLAKHHLRPMAGGAPFITCYYCLKLLQIPTEFLLVKRQCNRLKCGHCSKVLEFSLQRRTHIVPYVHSVSEPPLYERNELDDYTLAITKSGSREIDDATVLPQSSRQDMEKEISLKWSRNKIENLKKSYQSDDPSSHAYKASKLSSEVGKLSTKSNSPLHRLMGYASPSQVFRGLNASRRSMQRKY